LVDVFYGEDLADNLGNNDHEREHELGALGREHQLEKGHVREKDLADDASAEATPNNSHFE